MADRTTPACDLWPIQPSSVPVQPGALYSPDGWHRLGPAPRRHAGDGGDPSPRPLLHGPRRRVRQAQREPLHAAARRLPGARDPAIPHLHDGLAPELTPLDMVKLTKIYTRGGDKGRTSLGDGSRVAKHDLRVEAYGTVDEANAALGLARLSVADEAAEMLARIQNDLFDLGADLCRPEDSERRKAA